MQLTNLLVVKNLFFHLFEKKPGAKENLNSLTFEKFIKLLEQEEEYYKGQEYNTKLMFTRLRKIYYDSWGWSTHVIRKAAKIPGRYKIEMIRTTLGSEGVSLNSTGFIRNLQVSPLDYKVTYTNTDKLYPERKGQTPEIYSYDNQGIKTNDGYLCDVSHILSGVDAYNHFSPVTPLPNYLNFFRFLLPSVKSNMDFATWLGDMASVSGDFLLEKLSDKYAAVMDEDRKKNKFSLCSDMVGNIDSYVITSMYNTKASNGLKVTEILKSYFLDNYDFRKKRRIPIFCKHLGLKNWNGKSFENENQWLKYYTRELRNATLFYIYGETNNFKGLIVALKIWLRLYDKELKLKPLLRFFLIELKNQIIKEKIQ